MKYDPNKWTALGVGQRIDENTYTTVAGEEPKPVSPNLWGHEVSQDDIATYLRPNGVLDVVAGGEAPTQESLMAHFNRILSQRPDLMAIRAKDAAKEAAKSRKQYPLATGCLDYFPDALMAVAHCSYVGNEQHNPGTPLHWDRSKSGDEADAMMRHFLQRGTVDTDGIRHSVKVVWRGLALLTKELEEAGEAPVAAGRKEAA